jgi:hypothetical protein
VTLHQNTFVFNMKCTCMLKMANNALLLLLLYLLLLLLCFSDSFIQFDIPNVSADSYSGGDRR